MEETIEAKKEKVRDPARELERNEEFYELRSLLETKHALFSVLWDLCVPVFDETCPTAYVAFSRDNGGVLSFNFNPDFWDSMDQYTRSFVCAHEALHVLLGHGLRTKNHKAPKIANLALDVVVNHTLTNYFDFNKEDIIEGDGYCWIDTVFPEGKDTKGFPIEHDREYEYYMQKLEEVVKEEIKKGLKEGSLLGDGVPIDDHSYLEDILDKDDLEKLSKYIGENLSDEEKKGFSDIAEKADPSHGEEKGNKNNPGKKAGTVAGNACVIIPPKPVKESYSWLKVIKKWKKKKMWSDPIVETWAVRARRHSALDANMILPCEREEETWRKSEKMVDVFFFQDTSYSCIHMKEMFFETAKSFPKDFFRIRAFCFDTKVYDVDLKKGKLYGFGGTAFCPIEERIQLLLSSKQIKKYPDAVFVFTDGESWDKVQPEYPEKWHWFLTNNSSTHTIPDKSNIHKISDFTNKK
jgi:hypothetical protein